MPTTALLEETVNRLCLRVRCLEAAIHDQTGWVAQIGDITLPVSIGVDVGEDESILVSFVAGPIEAGEHRVSLLHHGDTMYSAVMTFSGGTWWKHRIRA